MHRINQPVLKLENRQHQSHFRMLFHRARDLQYEYQKAYRRLNKW